VRKRIPTAEEFYRTIIQWLNDAPEKERNRILGIMYQDPRVYTLDQITHFKTSNYRLIYGLAKGNVGFKELVIVKQKALARKKPERPKEYTEAAALQKSGASWSDLYKAFPKIPPTTIRRNVKRINKEQASP
jgi:hypothetical protein